MSNQNSKDKENPFIEPENYWSQYNESMDKAGSDKSSLEFAKLCFLIFENENGKALMKMIDDNILMPNLVPIGTNNYSQVSTYYEGYKEAFRLLKMSIQSHKDYIKNN